MDSLLIQSQVTVFETRHRSYKMKKDADDGEAQSQKDDALIAFSIALGVELDSLGYVPAPGRSAALAKDLGIHRTQSYRLLKGLSFPNPDNLISMRRIGLSLDRLLDHAGHNTPEVTNLRVQGKVLPVVIQQSRPNTSPMLAAIRAADGMLELHALSPGQGVPEGGIGVQSLRVPDRHAIAIIEDDLSTLELLKTSMSANFYVAAFQSKTSLLESGGIATYDAFLVDWKLPDVDGDELVKTIRRNSQAPIFILTGVSDADDSIAKALDFPNVHHASKPVSSVILSKRISTAISG